MAYWLSFVIARSTPTGKRRLRFSRRLAERLAPSSAQPPRANDKANPARHLHRLARVLRPATEAGPVRYHPEIDAGTGEPKEPRTSRRSVLVRCDRKQAFAYVQAILQICADPEIAITKVDIAATWPRNEGRGR